MREMKFALCELTTSFWFRIHYLWIYIKKLFALFCQFNFLCNFLMNLWIYILSRVGYKVSKLHIFEIIIIGMIQNVCESVVKYDLQFSVIRLDSHVPQHNHKFTTRLWSTCGWSWIYIEMHHSNSYGPQTEVCFNSSCNLWMISPTVLQPVSGWV